MVLAVTSHLAPELTGPALVGGAGVGMLWPDLRERCMLGDTGSNVLGAGAGLGVVATTSPATWWVAVVVLAALNLASEAVSFSDVIGRTPPLRWLDRLGAPPADEERWAPPQADSATVVWGGGAVALLVRRASTGAESGRGRLWSRRAIV